MSTAKIREALWDMETNGAGPQPALARAALAELEAIEKAACVLVNIWGYAGDENPAEVLMRAIAAQRSGGTEKKEDADR